MSSQVTGLGGVRVHAIVGEANAGKGTIVRHLSGCRTSEFSWRIEVAGAVRIFAVCLSSLQERPELGFTPGKFFDEIARENSGRGDGEKITDVLIPLRVKKVGSRPSYSDYLEYFERRGWVVSSIAFLDSSLSTSSYPGASIYTLPYGQSCKFTPSNKIARDIIGSWAW